MFLNACASWRTRQLIHRVAVPLLSLSAALRRLVSPWLSHPGYSPSVQRWSLGPTPVADGNLSDVLPAARRDFSRRCRDRFALKAIRRSPFAFRPSVGKNGGDRQDDCRNNYRFVAARKGSQDTCHSIPRWTARLNVMEGVLLSRREVKAYVKCTSVPAITDNGETDRRRNFLRAK